MLRAETTERPADVLSLNILSNRGRTIRPKTLNQKRYVDSIDKHTITFGIGPAGTGKTYLAMAKAVQALQAKKVNRIILTRPAVEAGERLGLPARHAQREDRPLPAAALRRAARHDRPRVDPQAAGRRDDRGRPAGLHARPLAQRRVHHPRRGAEHLARADEDVPDPARLRLQDRGHRRRHPDRPARRHPVGAPGGRGASSTASRTSSSTGSPPTTSSGTGWSAGSSRPTTSSTPAAGSAASRRTRSAVGEHRGPRRVRARRSTSRGWPRLARFVMDRMRVHPLAELCIKAVDEDTIAELNEQWMDKEGPTDVLAFPMDELRPGLVNEEPEEGVLGDLVLCPAVAARQAETAGHGTEARARAAHRARHPAPARLRPRRARGAPGDVRAPGAAARAVARRATPE